MVPGTVQQCTVQTKEDTVQYILVDAQAPPSSTIETHFPCLYNYTVGSGQLYSQTATAVTADRAVIQTGKSRFN